MIGHEVPEVLATPRQEMVLDDRGNLEVLAYYKTGARVTAGTYRCTFCGHVAHLGRSGILPLCPACDSAEFLAGPATDARRAADSPDGCPLQPDIPIM